MSNAILTAGKPITITIDQLKPFQYDPRHTRNPQYDEIKASIKARGLDQPPSITQRPGETHYTIRSGGNTRLAILHELWKETRDEHFFKITCFFYPWTSEANLLAGHIAENIQRGQLSFIDKAQAVACMKQIYESRANEQALSLRGLSEKLHADGVQISRNTLHCMHECIAYIQPALPSTLMHGLSRTQVSKLLQLHKNLEKIWTKYAEDFSVDFFELWITVLSAQDNGLDNYSYEQIRSDILEQTSQMLAQDKKNLELELAIAENGVVNNPSQPNQYLQVKQKNTESKSNMPTNSSNNQYNAEHPSDRVADQQKFIEAHIVSPSQESETMFRTRKLIAVSNGEQIPVFEVVGHILAAWAGARHVVLLVLDVGRLQPQNCWP